MYEQIKTKPAELTIEVFHNDTIFHCRNRHYFFVNFKKIVENLYELYFAEELFQEFSKILRGLGFDNVDYTKVITPQWSLCSYIVNNIEDAFVIYYDNNTAKIRINFSTTKTNNHFVEVGAIQKSLLYFIGDSGIKDRIESLELKKKQLECEITQLKKSL